MKTIFAILVILLIAAIGFVVMVVMSMGKVAEEQDLPFDKEMDADKDVSDK